MTIRNINPDNFAFDGLSMLNEKILEKILILIEYSKRCGASKDYLQLVEEYLKV